ncbi:unnamed protein product [Ophioblennius macclurei]
MASKILISLAAVLFCFTLGIKGWSSGAGVRCCVRYTRKPVPFKFIRGYAEQKVEHNCRIEAIILITAKRRICADEKDEWVQKILSKISEMLAQKTRTNSSSTEEPQVTKTGKGSFHDGSGHFVTPEEYFKNNTGSDY